MARKYRVVFVTIVPSPYQRDLFARLAAQENLDLTVYYLEAASPDSPWPQMPLRAFEHILPGFWLPFGPARLHFNSSLPDFSPADFVVLSSYTSWTGQRLMRFVLRRKKWLFWGERLRPQPPGWKDFAQKILLQPISRATAIVGIGQEATGVIRPRLIFAFPITAILPLFKPCQPRALQATRSPFSSAAK